MSPGLGAGPAGSSGGRAAPGSADGAPPAPRDVGGGGGWAPGILAATLRGFAGVQASGLGEMHTDHVGGFVNPDFSPGSIGFFFFLILQDGELPLISLLLWRVIDLPLSPIMQHSPKRGMLLRGFQEPATTKGTRQFSTALR